MKVWFFVEGESELCFAKHMMRAVFPNARKIDDILDFVNQDHGDEHVFCCFDCNSVDNIPYRLKKYSRNIIASKALPMVLCDTEKLPCFTKRREILLSQIANDKHRPSIKFVFAKPCIEAIFWEFPEVIGRTVKKIAGYSKISLPKVEVPSVTSNFAGELNALCKRYKIRYRKSEFAEHFFGILGSDFKGNITLERFRTLLTDITEY